MVERSSCNNKPTISFVNQSCNINNTHTQNTTLLHQVDRHSALLLFLASYLLIIWNTVSIQLRFKCRMRCFTAIISIIIVTMLLLLFLINHGNFIFGGKFHYSFISLCPNCRIFLAIFGNTDHNKPMSSKISISFAEMSANFQDQLNTEKMLTELDP